LNSAEGLPAFFDRFETKTIGLEINKSSVIADVSDNALLQQIVQMIPQNFPFKRGSR
jgi:hypothetical protein